MLFRGGVSGGVNVSFINRTGSSTGTLDFDVGRFITSATTELILAEGSGASYSATLAGKADIDSSLAPTQLLFDLEKSMNVKRASGKVEIAVLTKIQQAIGANPVGGVVHNYPYNGIDLGRDNFAEIVATSMAHEFGHTLGLLDEYGGGNGTGSGNLGSIVRLDPPQFSNGLTTQTFMANSLSSLSNSIEKKLIDFSLNATTDVLTRENITNAALFQLKLLKWWFFNSVNVQTTLDGAPPDPWVQNESGPVGLGSGLVGAKNLGLEAAQVFVAGSNFNLTETMGGNAEVKLLALEPPSGGRVEFKLRFKDSDLHSSEPQDAFEFALYNSIGIPVSQLTSLSRTDAALNVQADGRLFAADRVHVSGLGPDGKALLGGVLTVDVDLAGVAAGTPLYLYFDLIGFGDVGSRVTVSDVHFLSAVPVASDDSATTKEDTPVTIPVLANDSIPAEIAAIPELVDAAAHGTALVNIDGTITYTPAKDYNGADTFTYRIKTSEATSATATVSLVVSAVNDAPVASPISGRVVEKGPAIALSPSYTDPDIGDTHTVTVDATGTKGRVTVNADSTLTYDPNGAFTSLRAGQTVTDTFTYTVTDGAGAASTALATVTITGQNDTPVASAISTGSH